MTGKKNKARRKKMYGDRNYGDRKWEERIHQKEGIILEEIKDEWISMSKLTRDKALIAVSIIILLFSAMTDWNAYSWLILLAIVIILMAWYSKK